MNINPILDAARKTGGQVNITLSVPFDSNQTDAASADDRPTPSQPENGRATHAPDFSAVNWFGTTYAFSWKQRLDVAALWRASEEGYECVSQESLLDVAESDSSRLRVLFRSHPAWGKMIVSAHIGGGPIGSYKLSQQVR